MTVIENQPEMKISAIVPWFGSKRGMAGRIARECCRPDGRAPKSFWELCVGSFAVSIAMPRCSHHHAVDLHGDLINLANIIRDPRQGPVFYRRLRRILNHETLFAESKAAIAADSRDAREELFGSGGEQLSPIDRAVAFFIVSWQGRNGVAGTERVNYQPAERDAEWRSQGRPDLAHLSRADLERMVTDAMRYIDDAKAAGGEWNWSGRPLPELVRELREAAEQKEGPR